MYVLNDKPFFILREYLAWRQAKNKDVIIATKTRSFTVLCRNIGIIALLSLYFLFFLSYLLFPFSLAFFVPYLLYFCLVSSPLSLSLALAHSSWSVFLYFTLDILILLLGSSLLVFSADLFLSLFPPVLLNVFLSGSLSLSLLSFPLFF